MSRVFIDGFEAGDLKLWDAVGGITAIATGIPGMDGTYCLNCHEGGDYVEKDLAGSAFYFAFRYRPLQYYSQSILLFYNGTTLLGKVMRSGGDAGVVQAIRGSSTVLASGATLAKDNTYLIEVYYKPHNTSGVFQVKVDGILTISFSGDTTDDVESITKFRLGGWESLGWYTYAYFDNVIVDNANWIGNTCIQAIVPTGAGNSTQWTPSSGLNYQAVDEVPSSEADFIYTNDIGHLDLYAAGDLVGTIGQVKAVQVQALTKVEGTPTPTHLQMVVRTEGADYAGSDKTPGTSAKQLFHVWQNNPDTGNPWTEDEINALEIGVKAAA